MKTGSLESVNPLSSNEPVRVHAWDASFRLIQTPIGLVVRELRVQGDSTTIHPEPFRLETAHPATWEAFIERDAVQYLLERKAPDEIRNIRADFRDGRIVVTGSVKILIEIPIEAVCNLEIRDGKQVWVVLDSVSVAGVGGKSLVERHITQINPLLDVADLPVRLNLDSITIGTAEIVANGTVAP